MYRLRGNTFLLLLLRAGNQILLNPQEYGESKGGITKPNMLADLIRLTDTTYHPAKIETLASYFSKYLSGDPPASPSYLPFRNPAYRHGLEARIADDYPAVLRQMDSFCRTYLTQEKYPLRLLVAGLVDTILADDSFDGEFDVGGKKVDKKTLDLENKFLLQPFLASVWSNILENHPDTGEGKPTYDAWTEAAGYNTAREITTNIGTERAKKIDVSTDLPEEILTETSIEDAPREEKEAEPVVQELHEEEIESEPVVEEIHEEEPRVEIYEAPYTDPRTKQQVVAQFRVEAKDNGVAIGQVFGGLVIGKRGKDE